jgi:hypothetical protein
MYVKVMLTLFVALTALIALMLARPPSPADPLAGRVEVPNSLNTVIDELKLNSASLERAVETLQQQTGANIVVNWNEFDATGIDRKQLVEVQLRNVTLLAALRVLFDHGRPGRGQHGEFRLPRYECEFNGGVVTVFNPSHRAPELLVRAYDVRDLLTDRFHAPPVAVPDPGSNRVAGVHPAGDEPQASSGSDGGGPAERLAELVALVQRDPSCADPMWGPSTFAAGALMPSINGWAGRLIVVQTAERHRNVGALLAELRRSR